MKPINANLSWAKFLPVSFLTQALRVSGVSVAGSTASLNAIFNDSHGRVSQTLEAARLAVFPAQDRFDNPSAYDLDAAPVGGVMKRMVDLIIASVALIALAPIMIMITILIYVTMGRPIFFAHERIGFKRSTFRCYKFRSMVTNSKEVLARHLAENPDAARMWEDTRKLKDDPRITSLGKFLRKSSLDELPQLLNILRGDMSCVGPRPVVADELEKYGFSNNDYLATRPGLTGLWQVSGRSNTTYMSRVCLDRIYRRRWSLNLDFVILFKTIPAVLRFRDSA